MMAALGLVLAAMTSLLFAMLHERESIFAMLEYGNDACEECESVKLQYYNMVKNSISKPAQVLNTATGVIFIVVTVLIWYSLLSIFIIIRQV
jgi:hypothetical protein